MCVEKMVGWLDTAPVEKKAAASNALARAFLQSEMTAEEREIAEATITVLLDDPNPSVRAGLAHAFADSADTPRHIVLSLADDEPGISLPILEKSPVLLAGELIEYAAKGDTSQQIAVASRENLRADVCVALGELADYEACLALILNPYAELDKDTFMRLAERFGDIDDMRKCLLARPDVPVNARILLIEKYAMSLLEDEDELTDKARDKRTIELKDACEKATITFAAQVEEEELHEIVKCLIETGRMNTAFLLRAICMGNIALFSHTLSQLGEMPLERVERILADDRRKAFSALYARAELPVSALSVFIEAINGWRNALSNNASIEPSKLPYLVTRQVLEKYQGEGGKEVDELLLLLRKICTETAKDNARETMVRVNAQIEAQERAALEQRAEDEALMQKHGLSENDIMEFAVNLADELAEDAVEQEIANKIAQNDLSAANIAAKREPIRFVSVAA